MFNNTLSNEISISSQHHVINFQQQRPQQQQQQPLSEHHKQLGKNNNSDSSNRENNNWGPKLTNEPTEGPKLNADKPLSRGTREAQLDRRAKVTLPVSQQHHPQQPQANCLLAARQERDKQKAQPVAAKTLITVDSRASSSLEASDSRPATSRLVVAPSSNQAPINRAKSGANPSSNTNINNNDINSNNYNNNTNNNSNSNNNNDNGTSAKKSNGPTNGAQTNSRLGNQQQHQHLGGGGGGAGGNSLLLNSANSSSNNNNNNNNNNSSQTLSIYINGNYRSNSIFCNRSSASPSSHQSPTQFITSLLVNSKTIQSKLSRITSDQSSTNDFCNQANQQSSLASTRFKAKKFIRNFSLRRLPSSARAHSAKRDRLTSLDRSSLSGGSSSTASSSSSSSTSPSSSSSSSSASPYSANDNNNTTSNSNNNNKNKNKNKNNNNNKPNQKQPKQQEGPQQEDLLYQKGAPLEGKPDRCQQQPLEEQTDKKHLGLDGKGDEQQHQQREQAPHPTYKLNPSSMFLRKAMRYYRVWIYCTNLAILLGTIIFILATIYVFSDYRINLIISTRHNNNQPPDRPATRWQHDTTDNNNNNTDTSGTITTPTTNQKTGEQGDEQLSIDISYYEPSFIYAYIAITVQAGLLQSLGCFGAIRMKEKLLQLFWYLILALMVGDLCIGVHWLHRYDVITHELRHHLTNRLRSGYGQLSNGRSVAPNSDLDTDTDTDSDDGQLVDGAVMRQFDKTFTVIMDRIQRESRCCGISSPFDYYDSLWYKQQQYHYNDNRPKETSDSNNNNNDNYNNYTDYVPIVPASCCRVASNNHRQRLNNGANNPQDGASRLKAAYMNLVNGGQNNHQAYATKIDYRQQQMSVNTYLDTNRPYSDVTDNNEAIISFAGQGQKNEAREPDEEEDDSLLASKSYKPSPIQWSPIEGPNEDHQDQYGDQPGTADDNDNNLAIGDDNQAAREDPIQQTHDDDKMGAKLTGPLSFRRKQIERHRQQQQQHQHQQQQNQKQLEVAPTGQRFKRCILVGDPMKEECHYYNELAQNDLSQANRRRAPTSPVDGELRVAKLFNDSRFHWPNEYQLNFRQYQLLTYYDKQLEKKRQQQQQQPQEQQQQQQQQQQAHRAGRHRKSLVGAGGAPALGLPASRLEYLGSTDSGRDPALPRASGMGVCRPQNYSDKQAIYVRGCHRHIQAWLTTSANIMLITGFCVLTFLKLCSVCLLRYEIHEMIRKIKVLKGMATEYNALHDLEAYLPRPSMCAQAAELTPSGVASATGCMGSGLPTADRERISGLTGLVTGGASATKAVAAMLSPTHTPTPPSLYSNVSSSAFLHHNAAGIMSRRHTAVSVSPTSAANAAAAAAAHFMTRRGTYVNPMAANQSPLLGSINNAFSNQNLVTGPSNLYTTRLTNSHATLLNGPSSDCQAATCPRARSSSQLLVPTNTGFVGHQQQRRPSHHPQTSSQRASPQQHHFTLL